MANPYLSYGFGMPPAPLNGGAPVRRAMPAWLNDYGYSQSLATNADKVFETPGVDPYSLLPRHDMPAQAQQTTAPDTVSQQGYNALSGVPGGSDASGMNGNQTGNNAGLGAAGQQFMGLFGALGDAMTGSGPSADNAPSNMSDVPGVAGGDHPGMADTGAAAPGFNHGGLVTRNRLAGPDPDGPDDGYAALDVGEGVLTAKALKHYGRGIVGRLNRLAVSKEALNGR